MTRTPAGPGYSTRYPHIDFETYSESGLQWNPALGKWETLPGVSPQKRGIKATGAHAYVEHPSFEILMLAYDLYDGAGERQWLPHLPPPEDLLRYVAAGGIVEAHNAQFEYWVWQWASANLGWPPLRLEQMRCSAAKAKAHAMPASLADLSDVLQLVNGKLADGKRLIDKWTMPRKPTKGNPRLRLMPADDPEDWEKFKAYNVRDIVAEAEASARLPDLTPAEFEYWQCDQRINDRGVHVDMAGVENCIAIVEQAFAKYNAELQTLAGCNASELPKLSAWCERQGVYMASMAEEFITATLERPDLPAGVRRALEIRQLIGSAAVKKLFAIRAAASRDGRLRGLYGYHVGRTGRWAGMGPQPQNLFASTWGDAEVEMALARIATRCLELVEYYYGDALDAVCQVMRGLFDAAPGCELIGSDYRGIENVVAAGLAGEEWILEVYRTHGLMYEATASAITGIPLDEYLRHKRETGDHHPTRQSLGKPGALGSQFGGWIGAWKNFGADKFLSDEEIKAAILAWRAKCPNIVEMWGGQTRDRFQRGREREELYGLEGAAVAAVKYPGQSFHYRQIAYQTHGDALYCRLPSGRLLTYHEPRLRPSAREYARPWELELSFMGWNSNPTKGVMGWDRMFLYAGIIYENVTQAAARDVLAGAMPRVERARYPIVMHTHDELTVEVPEGFGSVAEFEALMIPPDDWCRGWPIKAAGGWRGKRYG